MTVTKDYVNTKTFSINIHDGGRIPIPTQHLKALGIERGDRLRVIVQIDEAEETVLSTVIHGNRLTIPILYRKSLGIKRGDRLKITIQIDPPRDRKF